MKKEKFLLRVGPMVSASSNTGGCVEAGLCFFQDQTKLGEQGSRGSLKGR